MARADLETHLRYLENHADELLQQALTGVSDTPVRGFRFRTDATHFRAHRDVSIGYQVWSTTPDGTEVEQYLVVTTARVKGDGVVRIANDEYSFRVWQHPQDPVLESTAAAYDPTTVQTWLQRMGNPGPVRELSSLVYRPMRRAVLRATTDTNTYFVKVQRPRRHLQYVERMAVLAPADVTAPILSVPAPGVCISAATPGTSLAHALAAWSMEDAVEPEPASLVDLLDRIPSGVMNFDARSDWDAELIAHAEGARVTLGSHDREVSDIVSAVREGYRRGDRGPVVPTHGDFYEANIFTIDGRASSFIDTDAVGPGHRAADFACLMAHLVVLPDLSSTHYRRLPELLPGWQAHFEQLVDPVAFRARVAATVLSLINGSGPEQARARLAIAEQWAGSITR